MLCVESTVLGSLADDTWILTGVDLSGHALSDGSTEVIGAVKDYSRWVRPDGEHLAVSVDLGSWLKYASEALGRLTMLLLGRTRKLGSGLLSRRVSGLW